ncbi:MAG: DapH/DapD/GlmU-related protein [Patescibacteria group bacterium]
MPGFWAILVYRYGNFFTRLNIPVIKQLGLIAYFPFKILVEIFWGVSISRKAKIGPGFFINHFGCIFIHFDAQLGQDCVISQEVTIGVKGWDTHAGAPKIGDRVRIGPGAKILGPITIGDNSIIGANAVVTKDVEANSVVGGVPAKFIKTNLVLNP